MTLRPGAVPPHVPDERLRNVLAAYDLPGSPGEHEVRSLRRGFNDHYELTVRPGGFDSAPGRYILRIYLVDKPYIRGVPDVEDELETLAVLAREGVRVSPPVARRDGALMTILESDGVPRPAALFSFASGEERRGDDLGSAAARDLGRTVARMHAVADARDLGRRRYTLDETFLVDRPVATLRALLHESGEDAGFLEAYGEQLKARLRALSRTPGVFGLIHADLHTGNFREVSRSRETPTQETPSDS